jgi:hypothetical protein
MVVDKTQDEPIMFPNDIRKRSDSAGSNHSTGKRLGWGKEAQSPPLPNRFFF